MGRACDQALSEGTADATDAVAHKLPLTTAWHMVIWLAWIAARHPAWNLNGLVGALVGNLAHGDRDHHPAMFADGLFEDIARGLENVAAAALHPSQRAMRSATNAAADATRAMNHVLVAESAEVATEGFAEGSGWSSAVRGLLEAGVWESGAVLWSSDPPSDAELVEQARVEVAVAVDLYRRAARAVEHAPAAADGAKAEGLLPEELWGRAAWLVAASLADPSVYPAAWTADERRACEELAVDAGRRWGRYVHGERVADWTGEERAEVRRVVESPGPLRLAPAVLERAPWSRAGLAEVTALVREALRIAPPPWALHSARPQDVEALAVWCRATLEARHPASAPSALPAELGEGAPPKLGQLLRERAAKGECQRLDDDPHGPSVTRVMRFFSALGLWVRPVVGDWTRRERADAIAWTSAFYTASQNADPLPHPPPHVAHALRGDWQNKSADALSALDDDLPIDLQSVARELASEWTDRVRPLKDWAEEAAHRLRGPVALSELDATLDRLAQSGVVRLAGNEGYQGLADDGEEAPTKREAAAKPLAAVCHWDRAAVAEGLCAACGADEWAADAVPSVADVDEGGDAAQAAAGIEADDWERWGGKEATPEGLTADAWRAERRNALVRRFEQARAGEAKPEGR